MNCINISIFFKNVNLEKNLKYIHAIARTISDLGANILINKNYENYFIGFKIYFFEDIDELMERSDILIVFGGDGTILKIAKLAAVFKKPILGINGGKVGFISTFEKSQVYKLRKLREGKYRVVNRTILETFFGEKSFLAINDIVLNRSDNSQISNYEIYSENRKICSYRSDGVIFSTPTGSSAYSLSAGGPIIKETMKCLCITPICAYSLFNKSVILDDEEIIVKYFLRKGSAINISIDGELCFSNFNSGSLKIKIPKINAKFITFDDVNCGSMDEKFIKNKI